MVSRHIQLFQTRRQQTTRMLNELLPLQRVAFACSCCERLCPNVIAFGEGLGMRETNVVRPLMDRLWSHAGGRPLGQAEVDSGLKSLTLIPLGEDQPSSFLGVAQEGVGAIEYTLRFARDGETARLVQVAQWCVEGIRGWIDDTSVYNLAVADRASTRPSLGAPTPARRSIAELKAEIDQYNDWVDEHPMMKAEIAKQLDDLAVIRETPSLSADFLDRLKESSSGCGIQPFVRGLLPQSPGYRKRNSKRARS